MIYNTSANCIIHPRMTAIVQGTEWGGLAIHRQDIIMGPIDD